MFNRVHPFYHGLLTTTLFGLVVGTIVSIGFDADVIKTPPAYCQDRVVALSVSNKCPTGTYLELQSDDNGETYVVCHCEQPINFTIQMSPSLEQLPDPGLLIPKAYPPPGPIEL